MNLLNSVVYLQREKERVLGVMGDRKKETLFHFIITIYFFINAKGVALFLTKAIISQMNIIYYYYFCFVSNKLNSNI